MYLFVFQLLKMMKFVLCIAMLMAIAAVTLAAPEPEARFVPVNIFSLNPSLGRFHQQFCQAKIRWRTACGEIFARKIQSLLLWTAFGKQRTNSGNFSLIFSTGNIRQNCWWNWMANFSPNAVRLRLFAWRTLFGEIDPLFIQIPFLWCISNKTSIE